jgi:hypothetical protein
MDLSKFFGSSWRTTLWGGIALLCGAISFKPDLVKFLPDHIEGYVIGISGLITFLSGGAFVMNAKDSKVTGGTIQAKVPEPKNP